MSKMAIYRLGTVVFGLSYYWLKGMLNGPVFLMVGIACAVALRLLAERFGRQS